MSLTLVGDLAWPSSACTDIGEVIANLRNEALVANLEGPFLSQPAELARVANRYKFNLYSVASTLEDLSRLDIAAVGLANNHITDYVRGSESTTSLLKKHGLPYFGLATLPYIDLSYGTETYRIVGFASPLTELGSDGSTFAPNPFRPRRLLSEIAAWRSESPSIKIVVYAHWGYELSQYPLPADREWAKRAIEAGADYVIGHHPHVVQGIEKHGNGVIAYSLGNFILPQVEYRNRLLKYLDTRVNIQLTLSLEADPLLRWFRYVPSQGKVIFDRSERLSESVKAAEITPFAAMDDRTYRRWFGRQLRQRGIARKAGEPIIWSYQGLGRWQAGLVVMFLAGKRLVRKALIAAGLHRPYNWSA